MFNNLVRSDGFSVDFVFVKKRIPESTESRLMNSDLLLQDFKFEEVKDKYNPISIDPGRKSVFTAAVGIDENVQIRRCTTSEYYHNTGSNSFSKKQKKKKSQTGIDKIESAIPSCKTSDILKYENYAAKIFSHLRRLFDFYGADTAHDRFNLYQGRQRAADNMVNLLLHGTSKYSRAKRDKKKRSERRKKKKKKKDKKKGDEGLPETTEENK